VEIRLRARWELALRDPHRFQEWFLWTLDTHGNEKSIRPFPHDRPHVHAMTDLWLHNQLISIRKSRQMLMTWWGAATCLWDVLHPGKLIVQQSKKQEDAVGNEWVGDGPLGRTKFMLAHIPGKSVIGLVEGRDYVKRETHIDFKQLGSAVVAIPEGGSQIRQKTASGIFSDESNFQPEFGDSYAAAIPCIRGGAWFLSISTAELGAAHDLHNDQMADR